MMAMLKCKYVSNIITPVIPLLAVLKRHVCYNSSWLFYVLKYPAAIKPRKLVTFKLIENKKNVKFMKYILHVKLFV